MNKKQIEIPFYLKRMNYFPGQILTPSDFQTEQNYFRERMRQHNLNFHGIGIVSGLEVSPSQGPARSIMVASGIALDALGNEIIISSAVRCPLPMKSEKAYLVLYWAERGTDRVPIMADGNETWEWTASRMEEYAILKYETEEGRTHSYGGIVLARMVKIGRMWKVDEEFQVQRVKI
jgi:hypothetical protein